MKRRLAYFSPLPPARTGIADYSRELLPYLKQVADITLFSDEYACLVDADLSSLAAFSPGDYGPLRWRYDLAIYHMGNSVYHQAIGHSLLRYPGLMVLHDYGLHQLWASQSIAVGNLVAYAREMAYARGLPGLVEAADVAAGRRPLPHFEEPLNQRFLDAALGVLVHSNYVAQLIRRYRPNQRVTVVPAPISFVEAPSLRAQLALPADACLYGSFGVVSHTKQLDAALTAFAEVRKSGGPCYYLIVGDWQARDVDVPALVDRLRLADAVKYTGYVGSLHEFLGWLAAVDVVINLRYPTVGETSAIALRALAAARALIVYDHGWYAELPSDACLKLPPLDQNALVLAMQRLAEDVELRRSLGSRGQVYAHRYHSLAAAASAYVAFAEQLLSGGTNRSS